MARSPLMVLPRELRESIWSLCIKDEIELQVDQSGPPTASYETKMNPATFLLLINKQAHAEVSAIIIPPKLRVDLEHMYWLRPDLVDVLPNSYILHFRAVTVVYSKDNFTRLRGSKVIQMISDEVERETCKVLRAVWSVKLLGIVWDKIEYGSDQRLRLEFSVERDTL